jgi:hypothetical protein
MVETQIIYLAQRYMGREAEALAEALDYKWKLEAAGYTPDKGFVVFSPIINSAFEDWCKSKDFVEQIAEGLNFGTYPPIFKKFLACMYDIDANTTPFDYLAYDCALIQGWLKHDYILHSADYCSCDGHFKLYHGGYPCGADDWKGCTVNGNDSAVLLAFCPSCFNISVAEPKLLCWSSKGAKVEYEFAKAHHIECVLVDSLFGQEKERI